MDNKVKMKESEKMDQCLDLSREVKKNLGYDDDGDTNWCGLKWSQGLSKMSEGLEIRRIETIQARGLLISARIIRKVLEI